MKKFKIRCAKYLSYLNYYYLINYEFFSCLKNVRENPLNVKFNYISPSHKSSLKY